MFVKLLSTGSEKEQIYSVVNSLSLAFKFNFCGLLGESESRPFNVFLCQLATSFISKGSRRDKAEERGLVSWLRYAHLARPGKAGGFSSTSFPWRPAPQGSDPATCTASLGPGVRSEGQPKPSTCNSPRTKPPREQLSLAF